MNKDILCLYYSRTGHTKFAMEEIAAALDCECVEMRDRVNRDGAIGWLRCGLDAMRRRTRAMEPFDTRRALQDYRLVILGTPIWAGRCSSIARGFLKRRGLEVQNIAYVVVHGSEELYKDVCDQMDQYVDHPHVADVSLRIGSLLARRVHPQCDELHDGGELKQCGRSWNRSRAAARRSESC